MTVPTHARRRTLAAVAVAMALGAALGAPASAQGTADAPASAFPSRAIRIVVPFAAGTGSDVVARAIGQKLAEQLGQPVVVENREGAGGLVGAQVVQKAPADGYTLMLAANPFTVGPGMYASPPYDPLRDFQPVAKIADVPIVLCANLDAPFRTLQELIAWAKAHPGKATYGSSGKGTPSQIEMELFKATVGIDVLEVPYKSTAQAMTDTIGGQVTMYPSAMPLALPQLRANKVRPLAIIDAKRTPTLPEVPTMAEAMGMPSYVATPLWYGFVATAGTPPEVIRVLHQQIVRAARTPDVRERLTAQGAQLVDVSNDEFRALMKAEVDKSTRLIKALGMRHD